MPDLLTPAFKLGAGLARALPERVATVTGDRLGRVVGSLPSERRRIVERNVHRVRPDLDAAALRRSARATFGYYGRYWIESFRLPGTSADQLDAGMSTDGYDGVLSARKEGSGCIIALPHLGSWEWAGFWLTRVERHPMTVVVERLEPPALFDWFADLRRRFGFEIVPLGPDAGRACMAALRANHVLALLCDRDIGGGGVEVEFFGERTTLPGGPATLALRTGAPLLPTAVYNQGDHRHAVIRPPLPAERHGRLRDDVARVTQDLAHELEALISRAPEQWHLMQPNWPSDRKKGL